MPYPIRAKRTEELTVDEWEVKEALTAYHFDEDRIEVWCPIAPLYNLYQKHIWSGRYRDPEACELSRQQFGVALRRVFDLEEGDRTRRRVAGKRVYGYHGLIGPESLNVGNYFAGRRPKDHDYYVEDATDPD